MLRPDVVVVEALGLFLCERQNTPCTLGKFIESVSHGGLRSSPSSRLSQGHSGNEKRLIGLRGTKPTPLQLSDALPGFQHIISCDPCHVCAGKP